MSDVSDCPVRALTCINKPDSSKRGCPGCPVTDGLYHPGVVQPVGRVNLSQWALEPEVTSEPG